MYAEHWNNFKFKSGLKENAAFALLLQNGVYFSYVFWFTSCMLFAMHMSRITDFKINVK